MNKLLQLLGIVFCLCFLSACSTQLRSVSYGDTNAPVQMDIYTDYKCAHCVDFFKNTFPALKEEFIDTNQLYVTVHEYPVINQDSWDLAKASLCSYTHTSENFFPIHRALFNTSTLYDQERLFETLEEHDIPKNTLQTCMNAKETEDFIQQQKNQATSLRIQSTPTFRIGNQQVEGNLPYSYFVEVIRQEQARTQ